MKKDFLNNASLNFFCRIILVVFLTEISIPNTVSAVTLGAYGFSKPIILNTSSITGGITTTLSNFPALIYIKDNALKTGNACGDKVQFPAGNGGGSPAGTNYDFAFTLPGSTAELNYQVDTYDSTNGILLAWVQIPQLTNVNTNLTFYFGSPSPAHSAAFSASTWASDYLAVYHFSEGSASATILDATSNGRNAVQANTIVTNDEIHTAAGIPVTGGAYSFNGTNTSIIQNAGTKPDITGTFTISAWVYYNGPSTSDNKLVSDELDFSYGYKLSVKSSLIETETRTTANPSPGNLLDAGTVPPSTWKYIQGEYNGTKFINYINGKAATPTNSGAAPQAGDYLAMGLDHGTGVAAGGYNDANFFNGVMDEVRISNVAKSADWVNAEFYNQSNPATFTNYSGVITTYTTNATALTGALTYNWTGATSTDPTVASNWDIGQTPVFNGNTSLVVSVVSSNLYPSLTVNESIYALTIANGAQLNLNGYTLSVGCNIYNNTTTGGTGILYGGSSSSGGITWNGSLSAQTYTGTNTVNTAELSNMTINNSSGGTVSINGGPVDIYNVLTITKGNLVIGSSPAALTLKSTATQTASVVAIQSPYSITGTVNAERYITGGAGYRSYRLISSPVYAATVNSNKVYSINYLQTYAVLTGIGPITTTGFDKAGNPTLYLFREDQVPSNVTFTSGNFSGISSINNTPNYNYSVNGAGTSGSYYLPVGNGVMFFFRGNKASASLSAETTLGYVPVTVTTTTSGALNQGQVIVHDWYTPASAYLGYTGTGMGTNCAVRGFNLVGNPYASSIDWEQYNTTTTTSGIYANNVANTVYEFNPATSNYDTYQQGGAFTNHGTRTIVSGQGFFVLATSSTSPQLIFNETAKNSTQNTGLNLFMATKGDLARLNNTNIDQHLRLQMSLDSINTDDMYIGFKPNASAQFVSNEDAPYKTGYGKVCLSSFSSDGVSLAINKIPLPGLKQTAIPLFVTASAKGTYKLNRTELNGIPRLYEIWLMDRFNKDSLDMRHNTTYAFNITADTNSYGSKRFQLVIRQAPALMVHLLNFTASKVSNGAQVIWKTENEQNYTNFTVERSSNGGVTFDVLGGFASSASGTYSFLDKTPIAIGTIQYRLKLEDLNGNITYSNVVALMYANSSNSIVENAVTIYPNPAKSTLNLAIHPAFIVGSTKATIPANTVYRIKILNNKGSILKSATISQQNWQTDVSNLMPGTYVIQVVNNDDDSVVGKGTFIKL
jgi:hypothetical protein